MFRFVLLVLALPFVLLGAEGLSNATRARQQATLTCEQYGRGERPSLLVRITGCEIDYSGAAYRESQGQIRELFFPARPEGRGGAASLVAATNSPAALQFAQASKEANPDDLRRAHVGYYLVARGVHQLRAATGYPRK